MKEQSLNPCPFCDDIIKIVVRKLEKVLDDELSSKSINIINDAIKILETITTVQII